MQEEANPWTVNGEKVMYDNNWIKVTEYDVLNPAGGKGIYGTVHFKNIAVGVLPLDAEMNIYLIGQYRFALGQYTWELPEGGCPLGTSPLETAKRELLEEAGLIAGEWQEILKMHLSNSVSDEIAYVYLARQLQQRVADPEETEQLQIRKLPFEEAYRLVEKGEITDSITVAAILKVKLLLL